VETFPENNTGIFELTGNPSDMGKFRAPSLRNIELTGPYMHDGSMSSLSEVEETSPPGLFLVMVGLILTKVT
jgi:cytochrome c peroxidase